MAKALETVILAAPAGSDLYRQALRLREDLLRAPLGLTVTESERADDAARQHFCAVAGNSVVGTVSLKPLDDATLHLKQMAVAAHRQSQDIGARLVRRAEEWGAAAGFETIIAHARIGAEGFYLKLGYALDGDVFEEQTIPHIRVVKQLSEEDSSP